MTKENANLHFGIPERQYLRDPEAGCKDTKSKQSGKINHRQITILPNHGVAKQTKLTVDNCPFQDNQKK